MSLPERREPDGVSGQQEQTQAQSTSGSTTCVAVQTNLSSFTDDTDELCQRFSDSSIGEDPKVQEIPVCLHMGQQGVSPVLITLPFQNPNTLQTFVPCDLCHHPGASRNRVVTPSDSLAFCVCEVNIQTAQLTLVPCFLCWQPNGNIEIPSKITVPLFPTVQPGTSGGQGVEPEVHFVPCALCLQPNHCAEVARQMPEIEEDNVDTTPEDSGNEGCTSWYVPFADSRSLSNTTLQMAFILRCGNVIRHSRQRQREISQLAKDRQKQVSLTNQRRAEKYLNNSRSRKPAFKQPINFTHKFMREQTERIYKKLPEVKESQKQRLKSQLYHTHKLMAYIFQKRLQRATLQGKVSWQITESCL